MKILIDAGYLPNSIITIASNLAQDSEINFEIRFFEAFIKS